MVRVQGKRVLSKSFTACPILLKGTIAQKVTNANPFPDKESTLRPQLSIIALFFLEYLEVPLLVPLHAFLVGLPHVRRDTAHTMKLDGLLHYSL
jgi:hypothetical protein